MDAARCLKLQNAEKVGGGLLLTVRVVGVVTEFVIGQDGVAEENPAAFRLFFTANALNSIIVVAASASSATLPALARC